MPSNAPNGTYVNTTSPIMGRTDAGLVEGLPATDNLVVVAPPNLSKSFTDGPVVPGDQVTLEFTLTHSENAPGDATNINFTDNLDATLSGLVAKDLPLSDICGTGSQLSGTTHLSFTGGHLIPGESCTFSATLEVPRTAPTGDHTNVTSSISATMNGEIVDGNEASADLEVEVLSLTKTFTDDPVPPGDSVTLEFTLTLDPTSPGDATSIIFTDNLGTVLSGLVATGLPIGDVCGSGSQLSGTTNLVFTGGNLTPGASCTFAVTLAVGRIHPRSGETTRRA